MSGATFSHQQPCFLSYLPSVFSLFHTSILNFFLSFLSCPLVPSCSFFLTFFLTHLHLLSSHAFVSFSPLLVLICECILKLELASFKTPSSMLINLANLAIAVLALLWSNGALVNRTGIVIQIFCLSDLAVRPYRIGRGHRKRRGRGWHRDGHQPRGVVLWAGADLQGGVKGHATCWWGWRQVTCEWGVSNINTCTDLSLVCV